MILPRKTIPMTIHALLILMTKLKRQLGSMKCHSLAFTVIPRKRAAAIVAGAASFVHHFNVVDVYRAGCVHRGPVSNFGLYTSQSRPDRGRACMDCVLERADTAVTVGLEQGETPDLANSVLSVPLYCLKVIFC